MARRRDDDDDDYDDDDDDDDRGRGKRRKNDDDDDEDRPRGKKGGAKKRGKKASGPPIGDLLFFRRMIGPQLVSVIFMVGLIVCLYMFVYNISQLFGSAPTIEIGTGSAKMTVPTGPTPNKLDASMGALFYLLVAPLIVFGFCEALACLIRIADSMDALKKPAEGEKKDEPQEKKPEARKDDDEDYDDDDE
jgi:hypothetical protein